MKYSIKYDYLGYEEVNSAYDAIQEAKYLLEIGSYRIIIEEMEEDD